MAKEPAKGGGPGKGGARPAGPKGKARKPARKTARKSARKKPAKKRPSRKRARKNGPGKKKPAPKPAATPAEEPIALEDMFPDSTKQEWEELAQRVQKGSIAGARTAYLNEGLVLYVGAGVSRDAGVPKWDELIRSLSVLAMSKQVTSAVDAMKRLNEEEKRAAIGFLVTQVSAEFGKEKGDGPEKPVLMMARAIQQRLGDDLPAAVADALYQPLIMKSLGDLAALGVASIFKAMAQLLGSALSADKPRHRTAMEKSKLFQALLKLSRPQRGVQGVKAIVNFNYDDLLDTWLEENGVRCDTLLSGQDCPRPSVIPCYHVHGVLPMGRWKELRTMDKDELGRTIGNFVFSEEQYHTEYSDPYRWSNMTMVNQLSQHVGLFVGISLEDPNHRRLLDVTHRQFPETTHYAIVMRTDPMKPTDTPKQRLLKTLFEQVQTDSFAQMGVNVIWANDKDDVPERVLDICDIDGGR